jgi:TPR repeat protein
MEEGRRELGMSGGGAEHNEGKMTNRDSREENELIRLLDEDAETQFRLGHCFYADGDFAEAAERWRKAAEQGHAEGQSSLGGCLFDGKGIEQDFVEAVEWYRRAAEQGHAHGQCSLGGCLLYGNGVDRDFAEAAGWYRKAAAQGQNLACEQYGMLLSFGFGVPCDCDEALVWLGESLRSSVRPLAL